MYEPSVNINLCLCLEVREQSRNASGGEGAVKHFSKYKAEMAINNRWASFGRWGRAKKAPLVYSK